MVYLSTGGHTGRMNNAVVDPGLMTSRVDLRFLVDDALVAWSIGKDRASLTEALATLDKLRAGVAEAIASLPGKQEAA